MTDLKIPGVLFLATIAIGISVWVSRTSPPPGSLGEVDQGQALPPAAVSKAVPAVSRPARDNDHVSPPPDGPSSRDVGANTESLSAKRKGLALDFGVDDHGPLDAVEAAKVTAHLRKSFDGYLRQVGEVDPADMEGAAATMVGLARYADALELFAAGEYLTVEPALMPERTVPGRQPMVLMSAASLGNKRVGVLLPIRIQDGSDMEKAAYVQKLLANARVTSAIAMFNQQSLEIRAQKGQAMLDARRAINEAVASQQQGKTTGEELQRVMAAYRANLPPDGTWIDRDGWMLRQ